MSFKILQPTKRNLKIAGTITVFVFFIGISRIALYKSSWLVWRLPPLLAQNDWKDAYKRTSPPKIPKIIHQIWNELVVPNEFVDNVKSFVKYNKHPEWEYYFWTHDLGREFIRRKFPELLDIYDCSHKYTKPDILRFVLIYYFGGTYFDLDVISIRPLDSFVTKHACALSGPIPEHVLMYNITASFGGTNNAVFLCQPNHPFFKYLITRTVQNWKSRHSNHVTCPRPEFPVTLLPYLNDTNQNDVIPEIVDPRFFEPFYDLTVTKSVRKKCSSSSYPRLNLAYKKICDNWKRLGEDRRSVHEDSYTIHTWYHSSINPITRDPKNRIYKIVPHVKIFDTKTGEMS